MERIAYAFGDFRLDAVSLELRRDGVAIALEPKAFDVLCELLTHAGALLSRDQLLDAVWGHRHVSPEGKVGGVLAQDEQDPAVRYPTFLRLGPITHQRRPLPDDARAVPA